MDRGVFMSLRVAIRAGREITVSQMRKELL
jgi:hypothetical protein